MPFNTLVRQVHRWTGASPLHRAVHVRAALSRQSAHRIGGCVFQRAAHASRPWRIHEIAPDFELEDVWALPTPGGPDDFARLVKQFSGRREASDSPLIVRALFALRFKLGKIFGWDKQEAGVGARVRSLRERLPPELREETSQGPDLIAVADREGGPRPAFSSVYQTRDEWAAEVSNQTVHAVMHIGWVRDDSGSGYHAQMAVLVKPNGLVGRAYMALIRPFRLAIVYPLMLRSIGQKWRDKPLETERGLPT